MSLPLFPPGADPGPDFSELLRRLRLEPAAVEHADPALPITHGTTIVALRYTEGVVLAGGRYEESDFHADGSGGRDARTTVKLGWTEGLERAAALELAIQALYEAADEDSATGGPDAVRGIYPTLATITDRGYDAVPEAEVAERFAALIEHKSAQGRPR